MGNRSIDRYMRFSVNIYQYALYPIKETCVVRRDGRQLGCHRPRPFFNSVPEDPLNTAINEVRMQ